MVLFDNILHTLTSAILWYGNSTESANLMVVEVRLNIIFEQTCEAT